MVPTDDSPWWFKWASLGISAALGVVAGWWKGRLVVREDSREDKKATIIHGTYEELVLSLRDEVRRLREELKVEYDLRVAAEQRVGSLLARVAELERRCNLLPSSPPTS